MNTQYFQNQQERLLRAQKRIEVKLQWFKDNSDNLSEDVRQFWDSWHDLSDRINDRLLDNWQSFKSWHWDNYGFNSY